MYSLIYTQVFFEPISCDLDRLYIFLVGFWTY